MDEIDTQSRAARSTCQEEAASTIAPSPLDPNRLAPLPQDLTREDRTRLRLLKQRLLFAAMFFIGTITAAIGWFIEWKGLNHLSTILDDLTILALIGHALQVVGAFGYMLTPDDVERDEEE